jgi:hypothetical protein
LDGRGVKNSSPARLTSCPIPGGSALVEVPAFYRHTEDVARFVDDLVV